MQAPTNTCVFVAAPSGAEEGNDRNFSWLKNLNLSAGGHVANA